MKKGNKHITLILAMSLSYIMLVCGCGSEGGSKSVSSDAYIENAYESEASDTVTQSYDNEASDSADAPEVKKSNRKLITNMSMTVETKEFDSIMTFIQNRTEELGGYVESLSVDTYPDESRYSNLTLRIPEENLDSFVNEVSEKSNITSQSKDVEDVTLTYTDLESHKNALRAEEEQLMQLMQQATTIEEIMQIQEKLTDVRYQIESMESQLRTFDNQITYSTLKVNLREVVTFTPESNQSFMDEAKQGFIENFALVISFFRTLLLLIITHIPTLLVLLIIVGIVLLIVRASDKRYKKKLAERIASGQMNAAPYRAPINNVPPTYGPNNQAGPSAQNPSNQQGANASPNPGNQAGADSSTKSDDQAGK